MNDDAHTSEGTSLSEETYREMVELTCIGNRAVRRAQEENRRRGIPNVYSIRGHIYYEQPDGTLALEAPASSAPRRPEASGRGDAEGES